MALENAVTQDSRLLYEQPQSKTLLFTTAISSNLQQLNGRKFAKAGIFQCTLSPDNNFDDFNDGDESREICHVASKLADRNNFYLDRRQELELRNIQFDLSSLRSLSNEGKDKKNFLYANTHGAYHHDMVREPDWEIVRAELPKEGDYESDVLGEEGTINFESVFRTIEEITWNECDFDCCIQDDKIYDRWDDSIAAENRQAFVRAFARSFAVDEHTGDVFISWEGFFKDCGNVFGSTKKLQWTIGVSRLRMEDPTCVLLGKGDDSYLQSSHFARCTEPVSIVHQSTSGRDVVMSYGGFAVIPASSTGESQGDSDKRNFLLSVLYRPKDSLMRSTVLSFPEGGNGFKDDSKRKEVGTGMTVAAVFAEENVWDGGTLRVHYDPFTGRPDHLCRTVFGEGIECMPIAVSIQDGFPVVEASGESQMFLSKEQTAAFCRLGDVGKTKRVDWERRTTLVTGLDVQWDDLSGLPKRIFFGCWGGEGGNGNFGSVERNGNNIHQVMPGAYADGVLFLPQELEGTIDYREPTPTEHPRPCVIEAQAAHAASLAKNDSTLNSRPLVAGFIMLAVALSLIMYKKKANARLHFFFVMDKFLTERNWIWDSVCRIAKFGRFSRPEIIASVHARGGESNFIEFLVLV